MLELHPNFLIGAGTICFSGVTLKTARPVIISCGSGELEMSDREEVLTDIIETGDMDLSEQGILLSGDFALEIVVMVTGDLALSGPRAHSLFLLFVGVVF